MAYHESMMNFHTRLGVPPSSTPLSDIRGRRTPVSPANPSAPPSSQQPAQLRPNTTTKQRTEFLCRCLFFFFFPVHFLRDLFLSRRSVGTPPLLLAKIDIIASGEPAAQVSEVRSGCVFTCFGSRFSFFFFV